MSFASGLKRLENVSPSLFSGDREGRVLLLQPLDTREMFDKYPSVFDCDDFGAFGFYEVWFGPGMHRPKFKPDIADFLTNTLLGMENGL